MKGHGAGGMKGKRPWSWGHDWGEEAGFRCVPLSGPENLSSCKLLIVVKLEFRVFLGF